MSKPARARPPHQAASLSPRTAAAVTLVLLIFVGTVIFAIVDSRSLHPMLTSISHGNVQRLRSQLNALGGWAVLALVALVLAHTILPFPAEILSAAGGFVLGVAVALPVLVISFLISALIAYYIGVLAGRPLAIRLVGAERLSRLERIVEHGGVRALLAVRLFPLMPFSPVCLACGVAAVPVRRYTWTSALGMLPELALVTLLGTRLSSSPLSDPVFWVLSAALIVLILVGSRLVREARPRGGLKRETY